MKITFLCPPSLVINGGIKMLFRMGQTLAKAGHNVRICEREARRPTWFPSDIPVVDHAALTQDPTEVFVLAEDQNPLLSALASWPQRKVVYVQNQFYVPLGLGGAASFADFGVAALLCSSETIRIACTARFPEIPSFTIPCGVDRSLFTPMPKRPAIAFMPRKRPIEAKYLYDLFRYENPDLKDWSWLEIKDKTEAETALLMGVASVFLSLSRLEGLGLTPLEAMASGSIVAGFTGIGGREYAHSGNGFWADEDDFPGCLKALRGAVDLARQPPDSPARLAYAKEVEKTLRPYTAALFERETLGVWAHLAQSFGL